MLWNIVNKHQPNIKKPKCIFRFRVSGVSYVDLPPNKRCSIITEQAPIALTYSSGLQDTETNFATVGDLKQWLNDSQENWEKLLDGAITILSIAIGLILLKKDLKQS